MAFRSTLILALAGTPLAGCAQVAGTDGISTGSITPSLTSITSMLPSASSLLPSLPASLSTSNAPQKAERIGTNLYRVYSSDRPTSDSIQAENYALLRAAETTKEAGATHFVVVDAPGQPSAGLLGSGGPSNLIRVLKLTPGAEAPIGAVSADEIIHFFGPTFGRDVPKSPA